MPLELLSECFKTCYLLNYMLISAFERAEIFKLLWLMEYSKIDVWSETFISGICYCTVLEEDSFILTYLMALRISLLASRMHWKNAFLGIAEN